MLIGVTFILSLSTSSAEATPYYPSDDAFVLKNCSNANYGSRADLIVGRHVVTGRYQTYLKFDLSLLSGSIIDSAALKLYKSGYSTDTSNVNLYRVTGDWNEETITWNNKPSYDSTVISSTSVNSNGWYTWRGEEFKDLIQGWVDDPYHNYGMVLMTDYSYIYRFYSKEFPDSNYRPSLEIESTPIPEPSTMILLGSLATGLFGMAGLRRKFSRR